MRKTAVVRNLRRKLITFSTSNVVALIPDLVHWAEDNETADIIYQLNNKAII